MTRQEANREILKRVSQMVEANPELRFQQVLSAMGINDNVMIGDESYNIDKFYEESVKTLETLR